MGVQGWGFRVSVQRLGFRVMWVCMHVRARTLAGCVCVCVCVSLVWGMVVGGGREGGIEI